jgi:hypothetical protein
MDYSTHLREETHVEHAVGFVEHKKLYGAKRHQLTIEKVVQSSGSGHDDIGSGVEGAQLTGFSLAADYRGSAQAVWMSEYFRVGFYLKRKLARGSEDERARRASTGEALDQRQQEGRRFPRSGFGRGHQVSSIERVRYGAGLNLCRFGDVYFFKRARKGRAKSESFKTVQVFLSFFPYTLVV